MGTASGVGVFFKPRQKTEQAGQIRGKTKLWLNKKNSKDIRGDKQETKWRDEKQYQMQEARDEAKRQQKKLEARDKRTSDDMQLRKVDGT